MTRVILNGTIKGLRGKIGNLIFRQLADGTTVVSAAPPEKSRRQKKRAKLKRSPAQKAHNNRVAQAAAYAKASQVNPVYIELAAAAPMQTAYNFALSDWFKAPVIHRVERGEGCILVEASDNIMVTKVRVTIFDEVGEILEKGDAVRREGDCWEFALPHAEGKSVKVEAWDLPGHVGSWVLPAL